MLATSSALLATIWASKCDSSCCPQPRGEDKPLKYPTIFNTADVALITKMDLADVVDFQLKEACNNIQSVRPGMKIIEVSSRTGQGMDDVVRLTEATRGALQPA